MDIFTNQYLSDSLASGIAATALEAARRGDIEEFRRQQNMVTVLQELTARIGLTGPREFIMDKLPEFE